MVIRSETGVAKKLRRFNHHAALQKMPGKKRKDKAVQREKNSSRPRVRCLFALVSDAGTQGSDGAAALHGESRDTGQARRERDAGAIRNNGAFRLVNGHAVQQQRVNRAQLLSAQAQFVAQKGRQGNAHGTGNSHAGLKNEPPGDTRARYVQGNGGIVSG